MRHLWDLNAQSLLSTLCSLCLCSVLSDRIRWDNDNDDDDDGSVNDDAYIWLKYFIFVIHPLVRRPSVATVHFILTRSRAHTDALLVVLFAWPLFLIIALCVFLAMDQDRKSTSECGKSSRSRNSRRRWRMCARSGNISVWKQLYGMRIFVTHGDSQLQSQSLQQQQQQQQHQRQEQQNWGASVTWSANYQTSKLKTGQINDGRTDGGNERQTHSPARQSVNEKYLKIQIETKTKLKWYKNKTKTKKHSSSQKKYLLRSLYARRSSNLFSYTTATLWLHSSYVERRSNDQFGK